jgi:uncharacterized protein YbjQ (UPF0145 family)
MTRQLQGWWGTGGNNQEIVPFAQALYTARHLAMTRAEEMARTMKSLGIVGMHIENDRQILEYETEHPQAKYLDLSTHFAVIGTAIVVAEKGHVTADVVPRPALTFTDLRPGRYGQNRELTFSE